LTLNYHVQVSNDSDFTNLFIDTITTDTVLHVGGMKPGYTYSWRVFVYKGGPLTSKKSASRSFNTAPAAPSSRGDVNGDDQVNALDITTLERIIAGLE
jgi:hypothetical protein